MLGVTRGQVQGTATALVSSEEFYDAYFGLGHVLRLLDRPGVFKLSPAGLALGDYLVRSTDRDVLVGQVLDVGTGSGALALLLRSLGARDIVATDVSSPAVKTAAENELLNFPDRRVVFEEASLFHSHAASGRFDLIVFNPPGWRAPSKECRRELDQAGVSALDLTAMFSGDTVLLDFLRQLPHHLTPSGRAVVGLKSMAGIREVFARLTQEQGDAELEFRLLERHSFPLFFYTQDWQKARNALLKEFRQWREEHGAAFSVDSDGSLHWSYEIVEIRLRPDL